MPIVCFFGPDGSGKTVIARGLAEELKSMGFKVTISWMRGTHTLASLLARFLSRFDAFRGPDNPYYGIRIPRNLRRLWQLIEFISILPVLFAKFLILSLLGYIVIAERYLPDFITWVALTTNDQYYMERVEAKFLLALSSKAEAKIYVTATLKELSKRRRETRTDFLVKQLKLYDRIASAIHAYRIDTTNRSVSESLKEVLNLLNIK